MSIRPALSPALQLRKHATPRFRYYPPHPHSLSSRTSRYPTLHRSRPARQTRSRFPSSYGRLRELLARPRNTRPRFWRRDRRRPGAGERVRRTGPGHSCARHAGHGLPHRLHDQELHRARHSPTARRGETIFGGPPSPNGSPNWPHSTTPRATLLLSEFARCSPTAQASLKTIPGATGNLPRRTTP
jgi:hypothetical protein